MAIPTRDPVVNLAILDALVGELERYLFSDELAPRVVYELPTRHDATTLTIGVLVNVTELLTREDSRLSSVQRDQLGLLVDRQASIRSSNCAAYESKLQRELKSHLDSWSWFLDDCARGEDSCRDDYRGEVWLRTRIEQLLDHAEPHGFQVQDAVSRVSDMDVTLRSVFVSGPYIGPAGDEDVFPQSRYWWLYGGAE